MGFLLARSLPLRRAHRPTSAFVLVSRAFKTRRWSSNAATRTGEPLQILYCGSDEFSCHSLRALDAQRLDPDFIASIDVVTRPGKFSGRNNKFFKGVPITNFAKELGLTVHQTDTFKGWTPSFKYNLVIAVSFGLFIPPRILKAAKYGGLNVHPSLLPNLPGASPIQSAILNQHTHTGITLQTLDHHAFDQGKILAQYPHKPPGIPISPHATTPWLTELIAPVAGIFLVDSLRQGLHLTAATASGTSIHEGPITRAPKLKKTDAEVPWLYPSQDPDAIHTADAIAARYRALGSLWTLMARPPLTRRIRVLFDQVSVVQATTLQASDHLEKGTQVLTLLPGESRQIQVFHGDFVFTTSVIAVPDDAGGFVVDVPGQGLLRVGEMKFEGSHKYGPAADVIKQFGRPLEGGEEGLPFERIVLNKGICGD